MLYAVIIYSIVNISTISKKSYLINKMITLKKITTLNQTKIISKIKDIYMLEIQL